MACACGCAAFIPAAIGLAITPLLLYKLAPPEIRDTPEAPKAAKEKLRQMGAMSRDEKIMMGTMAFALVLWVRLHCSPKTRLRPTRPCT